MKILIAATSLLLPFAAAAQDAPDPRPAAQAAIKAEVVRWHFPLTEGEKRYPAILGTNTIVDQPDLCLTRYTIRYAAFRDGGTQHPAVVRDVPMLWRGAARLPRIEGTTVILTWYMRDTGKMGTGAGQTFEWRLDTETAARARTFADAATTLIRACATRPVAD